MDSSARTGQPDTPRCRSLAPWGEALLLLALAVSVASVPYLPTHDGPQHIFSIHAANHLDEPGTGWGDWFAPNWPVSNQGFTAVFAPLDLLLPWEAAARVALVVLTLGWALGAWSLARSLPAERAWLGVALGAGALQWSFYMGFFSFQVASALGLFVLGVAARPGAISTRRCAGLALLLLVEAVLHAMAAVVTGLAVAALLWFRRPAARELLRVAGVGVPAAGVALAVLWLRADGAATSDATEAAWVATPWWTLGKCFLGGPAWRAWPLTGLALTAVPLGLAGRARPSPVDRGLWAAGAAFLLAALALPLHLPNWDFFSVRFVPLGVCLLVMSLRVERLPRSGRRAVAAACALFAAAATGWSAGYHQDLWRRSRVALAGLDAPLRRDGARLPIVLDPYAGERSDGPGAPMPFSVPLINLGKLYATAQGGFVPYSFTSDRAIHVVVVPPEKRAAIPAAADPRYAIELSEPGKRDDLALREAVTVYLAAYGTRYQDVILWGRPEDADHLEWLGFRPEWRRGGLSIARFEGCPFTVRLPDAELAEAAVLELGWYPAHGVTHRYSLSRARREPDGTLRLPTRQSCGAVWIGFQGFDASGLACQGADAAGRLVVRSTRETPEVTCRLATGSNSDPVVGTSVRRRAG
jgi:hypothetical protein